MNQMMPEEFAQRLLDTTYNSATLVLNDQKKIKKLLTVLEGKIVDKNSIVADLTSLLHAYADGQYRNISFETMKIATGALIYFVAGQDFIPDSDSELGFVDDQAVFAVCQKKIQPDLDVYKTWKCNGSFK